MAAPAAVLSILVTAQTSQASRGILRVNSQLGATEKSANKALGAVKTFAKGSALATAAGIGYAVAKAADFEQQLDSLGSVSNATGRQMEALRKQAMKAGADTKYSALEAAKAQTELAKGGLSVQQIMKGGLKSSLALAAAGEMDLAEAAETTANALNLFGLEGKASMKVADMLATAANATTADVSDFAMALKQGGSVAKTVGLSFGQTVLSLEALAKSGIRGSDAGTSLKTALIQLVKPTAKQEELTKKLGLNFLDAHGNMKSMADISGMLRDKLNGQTKAQRTATLATLAGTDGVRTLTSLYDAGPAKLDRWEKGLNKSGTAAEVAAKKQDNLKGKLENLQGSIETIAIAAGSKWLPALTRQAEAVTAILNDPKLTTGEKMNQLADLAGKAFSGALAKAADAAAKAAPKIAEAFVNGFLNAGVWGRLVITTFLLSKMGGLGLFRRTGAQAGGAFGTGFQTSAGPASARGLGAGLLAGLRANAPGIAVTAAAILGPELNRAFGNANIAGGAGGKGFLADLGSKLGVLGGKGDMDAASVASDFDYLANAVRRGQMSMVGLNTEIRRYSQTELPTGKRDELRRIAVDAGNVRNEISRLRNGGVTDVSALQQVVKDQMTRIGRSMGLHTKTGTTAVRQNTKAALGALDQMVQLGEVSTRQGMREIARIMRTQSKAGKDAVGTNFGQAIGLIRRYMRDGKGVTKEGMEAITDLFYTQARQFGISKKSARAEANRRAYSIANPDSDIGRSGRQRGGPIFGGKPTGDSVPAMLERGEYVLNRKAVDAVGRGKLDAINFGAAPRFQSGGVVQALGPYSVPPFQYDSNHAGGNSHWHIAMATSSAVVSVGKALQRMGFMVGEHPAFGGVRFKHASGGHHYTGQAIDVNSAADETLAETKRVAALLGGKGGGAGALGGSYKKIKRILIDGPDSPYKSMLQAVLDKGRSGANAKLKSLASSAAGPSDSAEQPFTPGSGSSWQGTLASIAKAKGWSVADWQWLVQKESGGNPKAVNPSSGAFGLGQFLGSTKDAYAKYGAASTDPVKQIQAMGKYIADRYGSPTAAKAFHIGHNWYSKGGPVGMAAGGLSGDIRKSVGRAGKIGGKGKRANAKRAKSLKPLLSKIRGMKLASGTAKHLGQLTKNADVFGEYADRASSLSQDGLPGMAKGKSEVQWLQQQLDELFKLRNELLKAYATVMTRRAKIATALNAARGMFKKAKGRRKTALGSVISGLKGTQSSLNTSRGNILESLDTVQGHGSMKILKKLPAVGELGGQIFDTQARLRNLGSAATATDSSAGSGSDATADLLRQANLRTAVSERQFKVLKDFPFGGIYHQGGVVPGSGEKMAVVRGGEGVFTQDQMAAMGSPSVTINVAPGMEWLKQFISVEYDKHSRQQARQGGRVLPGVGGGLRG